MCSACQRCPRKRACSLSRLLAHSKAGVHWRRRRSQNGIQKRRAIRCRANQTGGVGSRTSAYDFLAYGGCARSTSGSQNLAVLPN